MSSIKRLPDTVPVDGAFGDLIELVAAKGEFEPASFVIFSFENISDVEIKCSDLKGQFGTIPASAVDIKIVKCWYQAGTAWHSYFRDNSARTLIPELLLNDEKMIKVDTKKQENYIRVDYPNGSEYRWCSFPNSISPKQRSFHFLQDPVKDSPRLMPIQLIQGQSKQIWLTVHIPKNSSAGFYKGTITLHSGNCSLGSLNLTLRVLPFELPKPKTYYDLDEDFIVSIASKFDYSGWFSYTTNRQLIDDYIVAALKNMKNHNIMHHGFCVNKEHLYKNFLELMKKAKLDLSTIFSPYRGNKRRKETDQELTARNKRVHEFFQKNLPESKIYGKSGSEIWYNALHARHRTIRGMAGLGVSNYLDLHLKNCKITLSISYFSNRNYGVLPTENHG